MKPCEICCRPFKKERLAKHQEACKKKAKAIGQLSPPVFRSCFRSSTTLWGFGLSLTKRSRVETIRP